MSTSLHSEIIIAASPARVWQVLTDFDAYPDWNPFIRRIAGQPVAGTRLEVQLVPPGSRGMTLRPTVLEARPERALRWLGHLGVPGIFDGEHTLRIESLSPEQVRFVQSERFTGLLAPAISRLIARGTHEGFEAMNAALKVRAEAATLPVALMAA
jgi:hypothetical protein